IPGFDQYNTRVRQPSGFYLPNGAREGRFNTPDGKAHFTVNALPNLTVPPGRLVLMTLRSHDQYNTTLYGLDDRYRGIKGGRRVLLMHEADIRALGLEAEQLVDVRSFFGDEIRLGRNFRVIPYPISKGCIASYFPEANVLVPIGSKADGSHTPTSKWVEVEITPAKL
ncbi:MAG: molybdopterin dinucleotide binding domain-containing protein, partial [Bacteroidota bacterium]